MSLIRTVMKWAGITFGIAILSIIGFVIASWLSPGHPERSYTVAAVTLATVALILRIIFPDQDGPVD